MQNYIYFFETDILLEAFLGHRRKTFSLKAACNNIYLTLSSTFVIQANTLIYVY